MYTYAFLKTPVAPLALPAGIAGPVQMIKLAQLSALVEPDLRLDDLPTNDAQLMQAVLVHDRVLRQVFEQATILPLRFGTCFASLPDLVTHLATHEQSYLNTLAHIEGKAEYVLKFSPLAPLELPVASESRGKEYFLAKKKQYQIQQEQRHQQNEELKKLKQALQAGYAAGLIDQIYLPPPADQPQAEPEKIYLLVVQARAIELRYHLRALQQQCQQWQITIAEPLPPYHFLEN